MKQISKIKPKKKIPTLVYVDCPSCKKPRLLKEKIIDDNGVETITPVSEEKEKAVDSTERYVDICIHCINKFQKRDKAYIRRQANEMLKAMKTAQQETGSKGDIEL